MALINKNPVLCIGGAHVDRLCRTHAPAIVGTSNPGTVSIHQGGVARNVAENLARLGCQVAIFSRLGRDESGHSVLRQCAELGIDTSNVSASDTSPTGSFTSISDRDGEMVIGLADMNIYAEIQPEDIQAQLPKLRRYPIWFVDSNLNIAALEVLFKGAQSSKVCVGSVSIAKASRLGSFLEHIDVLFANILEGRHLAGFGEDEDADAMAVAMRLRDKGCKAGVVTAAQGRVVMWDDGGMTSVPSIRTEALGTLGAGDALAAGTIYGFLKDFKLDAALQWGLAAASLTVESLRAVSPHISPAALAERLKQAKLIS